MPNNDLISRAAAIDAIKQPHGGCYTEDAKNFAIYQVLGVPAVDAAQVVHARWIQYEPDLHGPKPLECGACHYLFARLYPRDFCPHCGAKMDGGETYGKS